LRPQPQRSRRASVGLGSAVGGGREHCGPAITANPAARSPARGGRRGGAFAFHRRFPPGVRAALIGRPASFTPTLRFCAIADSADMTAVGGLRTPRGGPTRTHTTADGDVGEPAALDDPSHSGRGIVAFVRPVGA